MISSPPATASHAARMRLLRGRIRLACAGVLLLAVAVRLLIAVATRRYEPPVYSEALSVARSLVDHHGFANPFGNAPTGPTAHVAPVYPFFLAPFLKLVPWGPRFGWVAILIAAAGTALAWALLPLTASRLGLGVRAGLLAALYGALYPLRHGVELHGGWETPYAALALMALAAATCRSARRNVPRPLVLGALWGLGMLLQPAFLPVCLAVLALVAFTRAPHPARAFGLALAGMCLVIAPWLVRNYYALGGVTFLRDNLGLELSVSNNPRAWPNTHENLHFNPLSDHPDGNAAEQRLVAQMGELAYNQRRLRMALSWIAANPSRFCRLTARRFLYFWAPQRRSPGLELLEGLISLGALLGLIRMFRCRKPVAWGIALLWIVYPLIYYVLQADERYRYPMEWTIALCAAWYFDGTLRRLFPRNS